MKTLKITNWAGAVAGLLFINAIPHASADDGWPPTIVRSSSTITIKTTVPLPPPPPTPPSK
jgi:hypothetical protein